MTPTQKFRAMELAAKLENIPKAKAHPDQSFWQGYHRGSDFLEPAFFFKCPYTAKRHAQAVQMLIGNDGIVFTIPHDFGFYTEITLHSRIINLQHP